MRLSSKLGQDTLSNSVPSQAILYRLASKSPHAGQLSLSLGVLKAGGRITLLLDPSLPPERLKSMCNEGFRQHPFTSMRQAVYRSFLEGLGRNQKFDRNCYSGHKSYDTSAPSNSTCLLDHSSYSRQILPMLFLLLGAHERFRAAQNRAQVRLLCRTWPWVITSERIRAFRALRF